MYPLIINAIETKDKTCCISLEFVKAFDSVNHNILLSKLEYHGMRGFPLKLMRLNFPQRTQFVKIGQNKASLTEITCGISQGSVLGPSFFLIFINDIHHSDMNTPFHLLVNYTALFYSSKTIEKIDNKINISLKDISNWLKANKLTLNVRKSKLLFFDVVTNPSKKFQ